MIKMALNDFALFFIVTIGQKEQTFLVIVSPAK